MKKIAALFLKIIPFIVITTQAVSSQNGVIIDSAATDYYNHNTSDGHLLSLYNDIQNHPEANIQYIFPDVGYITFVADPTILESVDAYLNNPNAPFDASKIKITVRDERSCLSPKIPTPEKDSYLVIVSYSFCAQPQIKRLNPDDYVPFPQPDLGAPVDLNELTTYYQSIQSSINTIPFINYDSDWVSLFVAIYKNGGDKAVTQSMASLSHAIGSSILKSPYVKGVGFDNEPSLSKIDTSDGIDSTIALDFFRAIAQEIGPKKSLFLFDANTIAKTLFIKEGIKNIVVLYPLYDFEEQNTEGPPYPISPNGPFALDEYNAISGSNVRHAVENGLNLSTPLLFVVPASATSTLWDTLQVYNTERTNPPNLVILKNVTPAQCNTAFDEVEQNILGTYLCTPSGLCPGGMAAINQYLHQGKAGALGCAAYKNQVGNMTNYFNAAIDAIKKVQANQNPYYLGTVLYTWRIPSYSNFACANHFYNVHSNQPKLCYQTMPAYISQTIWSAFETWNR